MTFNNIESATSMLIGKALDIMMDDFDFDPMEDISESMAPEPEGDSLEASSNDKDAEEYLRVARERRMRKQGNRPSYTGFDDDSLRHINPSVRQSFYSVASSTTRGEEEEEEFDIPLNDSSSKKDDQCSKDNTTAMSRTSLTSLMRKGL